MNLIIVESPTKAKTLARFLGKEYVVEATMGHVMDLPKSKLGVDVEDGFKPLYEPVAKRADVVGKIKSAANKAAKIYIATDPDREGEAIASHIKEMLTSHEPSQLARIVFHEITQEAVEEAIAHPRDVDANLVDAQIARRVLDRLVGYKLSPLLWKKVRIGLSAGRVQTVALRLIVEKEREIKAFKPLEYWEIWVKVAQVEKVGKAPQTFAIQLIKIGDKGPQITNGNDAREIVAQLEAAEYTVAEVKRREVKKGPYPPFTTSTMTQASARLFGWPAKRTMSVAQKLYEQGLITYHRTDSTNIAQTAISKVRDFIKKEYGENYLPDAPRFYKTSAKVAQEAHEAIRPTSVGVGGSQLPTNDEKYASEQSKLYDLVWKRFVASQMPHAVYDETTIDVSAISRSPSAISYLLRASGQTIKFDGWRKIIPVKSLGEDGVTLPPVEKGEELDLIKVDPQQKFTQPPARFNEASLIKTLEKLGIGRPSTYAPIISTIQVRNYVDKAEGKFTPTPVGEAVNDFLLANFADVFDYSFTADMEDKLDGIAQGKNAWEKTIATFWKPLALKIKAVDKGAERVKIQTEKLGKKCPQCSEGELVVRVGRFGKFISCSRFPECKYTEKFLQKIGMVCPECGKGEVIVKKSRKGRNFFGCSRYPECKWASWKKPIPAKT